MLVETLGNSVENRVHSSKTKYRHVYYFKLAPSNLEVYSHDEVGGENRRSYVLVPVPVTSQYSCDGSL